MNFDAAQRLWEKLAHAQPDYASLGRLPWSDAALKDAGIADLVSEAEREMDVRLSTGDVAWAISMDSSPTMTLDWYNNHYGTDLQARK